MFVLWVERKEYRCCSDTWLNRKGVSIKSPMQNWRKVVKRLLRYTIKKYQWQRFMIEKMWPYVYSLQCKINWTNKAEVQQVYGRSRREWSTSKILPFFKKNIKWWKKVFSRMMNVCMVNHGLMHSYHTKNSKSQMELCTQIFVSRTSKVLVTAKPTPPILEF